MAQASSYLSREKEYLQRYGYQPFALSKTPVMILTCQFIFTVRLLFFVISLHYTAMLSILYRLLAQLALEREVEGKPSLASRYRNGQAHV